MLRFACLVSTRVAQRKWRKRQELAAIRENLNRLLLNSLLIGANQRMILCKFFVVKEQMVPNRQRMRIERSTIWKGDLSVYKQVVNHGGKIERR